MSKRPYKRGIRDRILSLFVAFAIVGGIITGFATADTEEAKAESFTKQIATGGEITYTPSSNGSGGTIVYTKTHNKAQTNIQYYTKHFILSLVPLSLSDDLKPYDPSDSRYTGKGIPKWDLVKNGDKKAQEYAREYKAVMVDLQFAYDPVTGKTLEGVSLSEDEAESQGYDFSWWDKIKMDTVTTTYKFDAEPIFEFIEDYGELKTDKVYLSHIFALKWADSYSSSDSVSGFTRYEEYWTPNNLLNIGWAPPKDGGITTPEKIKGCYNIEVPLAWYSTANIIYYNGVADSEDYGKVVYNEPAVEVTKLADASIDKYKATDPVVKIHGRVTDADGNSWATAKTSGEFKPMMVQAKGISALHAWLNADTEYTVAIGANALDDFAAGQQVNLYGGQLKDYKRVKIHDGIANALKNNYGKDLDFTIKYSEMSKYTRTINFYIPVAPAGSAVYYNFYDFDGNKAISDTSKVTAGSYKEGTKDVTIGFSVSTELLNNWQLKEDGGAFEVSAASVNDIDTYGEVKNLSTKKTGTYNPSGRTYKLDLGSDGIENGKAYVVWIPLVKKAPKKDIWVGYYDSKNQTQVGSVHKVTSADEESTNVTVSVGLPDGENLPAGYAFDSTGAFDISESSISTYKQYSYAKNYGAKRNGTYDGGTLKYTVSKIEKGKDVIIWVPVSNDIDNTPVKVYVRYLTTTGEKLKDTTAPDAVLGTAYTYGAETSIVKNGVTYVLAPESKYGQKPPKAVYSTTSDNLSGTKYTTTSGVTAITLSRSDTDFSFTATAAGTKAVKMFIPMVPQTGETNVRIVYINSQTGEQVGSMVERTDMDRGDTIMPGSSYPSGWELDLNGTYQRLAVYKTGSNGIQSDYNTCKSKIPGTLTNLNFNNETNCNCDIPVLTDNKLAVKVFVPVKQGGGTDTMLAIKYFYIDNMGEYKFIEKELKWNTSSNTGRYAFNTDYSGILLKNTLYSNGKVYAPSTLLGMLYGDNGTELYGSENNINTAYNAANVFGYDMTAGLFGSGEKELRFTTMDKGQWHTAYVLCTEVVTKANVVIHYINAETGEELYKETNKDFLESDQMVQHWAGVDGSLVWAYQVGDLIDKEVADSEGNSYSPIYFVDEGYVTEHTCTCTDTRVFHYIYTVEYNNPYSIRGDGKSYSGQTSHLYYCTKCGGVVKYENSSLDDYGWSPWSSSAGSHNKLKTYSYPYAYKTRVKVLNASDSQVYTTDKSYGDCEDAKFDFYTSSSDKFVFNIKNKEKTSLGYEYSTPDQQPMDNADGNVMVLYIPCVPNDVKKYNVTVKYITLNDDGSAKDVIATYEGGKATVGERYTYTGVKSVEKDGKTYNVLGENEWLTYGTYKYGQGKGDTTNTKGNPADYDGGTTWTTQKVYSQEKDGTLYIPVAEGGMTVTVKYVVVKSSNQSIKKTIKEVNGGAVQYNTKYKYTGDSVVYDSTGKEYVVVGSGEALAYGTNSYKDALNDSGNTKGHKSTFDGIDKWTSNKKYKSYENGTLYIPVKESIPVTILYVPTVSGGKYEVKTALFEEPGLPAIPGTAYKTSVRPVIEIGGEYYQPVTGKALLTHHTTGNTTRWYDRTDTELRAGTMVTASIPADADEYYIFVPIMKVDDDEEELEPDPGNLASYLNPTATGVIKSDVYDVTKAIPSTEQIYAEVTTGNYYYVLDLKNEVNSKSYNVTVNQTVNVVSADDPDVVISTYPVSQTVTITRWYDYWYINGFALYVPTKATVLNGSLGIEAEMEVAFPGTVPSITKSILGAASNHITEPTYSSTYTMPDVTIVEGNSYSLTYTIAKAYADGEIGEITVKNDTFKIAGKTIMDGTAYSKSAADPIYSNLPVPGDGTSTIGHITKSSDMYTIPAETKNVKFDSTGTCLYELKDSVGTQEATLTATVKNINIVKVHTPVLAKLTITDDNLQYVQDVNADKTKAHAVVGRSDSYGSKGYENTTNDFVLEVNLNGKHISEKGYGTRTDYDKYVVGNGSTVNGTVYPKGVMVMFDFDVMANVGGDSDESNDVLLTKGTWNRMYPSYYVPEWVDPGTHTVEVRVYAVNAEGNMEDVQKNKNTTDTNYVAFDTAEIEISGKIYGLTLTSNSSTAPDWKDVFTLSSKIKWMYPNKYADGTFLTTFDKNSRYYYVAGIRNELGLDMKTKVTQTVKEGGKNVKKTTTETKKDKYIYPLLDGSSPVLKGAGMLKSGYTWNFRLDTVGRQTANDASSLVVVPTFYWISKDGTTREKVDLWYSAKIDGKTYNFVKAGSDLDKKNVFKDYALSDTMGIPTAESADVERIRGDKKLLSENVTVYTYGMISIPKNLKTFSNATYAELMKNKGSGYTYDQLLQLKQTWYFKYSLPDVYHICATGTDVEAYAKKNGGVTYKEDFWKKDGYLVVHFDIGAYDKNGKLVLCYTNTAQNVTDGMCDMWATEGYQNTRTDSNGKTFNFIDGDVIIVRLPGSTTPPGGDPNPPTNVSEDKLVNRTN